MWIGGGRRMWFAGVGECGSQVVGECGSRLRLREGASWGGVRQERLRRPFGIFDS